MRVAVQKRGWTLAAMTLAVLTTLSACRRGPLGASNGPAELPRRNPQAVVLARQAQRLARERQYARALPLAEQALVLFEQSPDHDPYGSAATLHQIAELHRALGAHERSNRLLHRALETREAVLGPDHPEVAATLHDLADGLCAAGEYEHAEALYQRALQIREARFGPLSPAAATTCGRLADLLRVVGRYEHAEALYQRALQTQEAALGPEHLEVARTLDGLALLITATGAYDRAEALYQRALRIQEAALGPDHPEVAATLRDLADLERARGAYDRAEARYQHAQQIQEAALGADHVEVAATLQNLADLLRVTGAHDRAEACYQRALRIRETALGAEHPAVAATLDGLADLAVAAGAYEQAEVLYRRALLTLELALGSRHPEVAATLDKVAVLLGRRGDRAGAEQLLRRALQLQESAFGAEHPAVAATLDDLGDLFEDAGDHGRAEPLYRRALRVQEGALGAEHPAVAATLDRLATTLYASGRTDEALALWWRATEATERTRTLFGGSATEARFATFLRTEAPREHIALALALARPHDDDARGLALSAVLLQKGRALAEAADASRAIARGLDPEDRTRFERLRALRAELAARTLAGARSTTEAAHRAALARLTQEIEQLDQALTQRSAPLRRRRSAWNPRRLAAQVAEALPRDGALVEFVVIRPYEFSGTGRPSRWGAPRYVALVVRPGGATAVVDLGLSEPIESAVQRLLGVLTRPSPDGDDQDVVRAARDLDARVMAPLRPLLGESARVHLSPDGALHLVPFEALHDGQGYLLDRYSFTYLTSGRDLLSSRDGARPSAPITVIADPDFTLTTGALGELRPLPGTRAEAEAIQRMFPSAGVNVLLGTAATEEAFLGLTSPLVLHVATHGVFFGSPLAPAETSRGLSLVGVASRVPAATPAAPDPMVRSALVLAGAQGHDPSRSAPRIPGYPDGLATALEITGMDLSGTRLVVLSACDSGRGDVALGEGVYGLRRAVLRAGAETLVTSLWNVHDATTRDLMERFYDGLRRGVGRVDALHEAMREVRARRPHPYFWAPFIAIGRGDPLDFAEFAATPGPPRDSRHSARRTAPIVRRVRLPRRR